MVAVAEWTAADRRRLRWARGIHGHSQKQAAQYLARELSEPANKDQWSRWESGITNSPRAAKQEALRRYIAAAEETAGAPPGEERPRPTPHAAGSTGFDRVVEGLTTEPIFREPSFGELQRELIRADITRLATVGSLGELDYKRLKELERLLGLVLPQDPS